MNYSRFINFAIKKKYNNMLMHSSNSLDLLLKFRQELILKYKKNISYRKSNLFLNDNIFLRLNYFFNKRNISPFKDKKILKYYKNFNVFLRLRNGSNRETNALSYLYLARILLKEKKINKLQKLNFILKILDKLFFIKNIKINLKEFQMLKDIVAYEKKCITHLIT
jgi:hypothetical protein